jgi:hypothetical protein
VVRYGKALMLGLFSLKNDVAALLVNYTISPIAAQSLNYLPPA